MVEADALNLLREALWVTLKMAGPIMAVSLIVGLIISVLQATTSIQEQTLTFAPRIVAVGLVMALCLPWTIRVLSGFMLRMMTHFVEASR